jgi:trigger factor
MDPGIDFEFTATFEVFPTIQPADFGQVAVKVPHAEINDGDVETMIERLREQRTTFEIVERGAQDGDQLKVDFEATRDGEVVEGTRGEDVEFRVGQGQMIDDFDRGVREAAAGQTVTFDATFPEDYRAEALQGQTVQFEVTVQEVREPRIPELDDAFFEAFGVTEGGEDAFRAEVRDNMTRELKSAVKNQVKQQVMSELSKLHEFQLPHAVVHREIHALKDQMLSQFQMGGRGQAPNLPDALFEDEAQKRVKVGLVVNEIISRSELEVDQEKLDARLQELAAPYGEPEQVIAWYRSNPEQLQSVEMGILEDQVVDLILSEAQVETIESSYDDVLSGKATALDEDQDDPGDVGDADTRTGSQAQD